jgi:hypothetical protein
MKSQGNTPGWENIAIWGAPTKRGACFILPNIFDSHTCHQHVSLDVGDGDLNSTCFLQGTAIPLTIVNISTPPPSSASINSAKLPLIYGTELFFPKS